MYLRNLRFMLGVPTMNMLIAPNLPTDPHTPTWVLWLILLTVTGILPTIVVGIYALWL